MCGNTYQLYLTSHNKIGNSPSSPVLSVRTQGQPPGIPSAASFLSPNSTTLSLRLHVWPDNGCPISYFVVQYRPINEFHWTLVSNSVKMQRRFTVTNLAPSSVYQLKVEAYNVAGSNQAEFTFVTLTRDGGKSTINAPYMRTQINGIKFIDRTKSNFSFDCNFLMNFICSNITFS